jgi:hypothetical protein
MKKYLTLPLLFMAFVAFAQPKIHSITSFAVGKENQKWVQLFDYQDNGLTIREQFWDYKRVDSTPRLTYETTRRFNANKQLLSEVSRNSASSRERITYKIDNNYDANGCLIENKRTSQNETTKASYLFLTQIKSNAKCLTLEETLKSAYNENGQATLDEYATVKKYEYDNKDSLKAIRYFQKDSAVAFGRIEYTRRADGKIVEILSENPCDYCTDYDIPNRFFIDYNANGQITIQKRKGLFSNTLMDSIVWSYNSNGKLSRETQFYFDRNGRMTFKSTQDHEYENFCDGLLKSRTTKIENQDFLGPIAVLKVTYVAVYTYTEAPNCDKKDLLDFTIAPNPAQWQATIASDALFSADNTLTIFNVAGAIVQSYKINYRTNKFDFSTLDLINGTYLIRLTNDKNSVTKKLVVLH